jgi:hypothetical protein
MSRTPMPTDAINSAETEIAAGGQRRSMSSTLLG